jgi:phosphatidate cytidylyltransferase
MAYDDDEDQQRPAPPRPHGEGVRIIGAQEAAKREAELRSGRLPDDAPRYGDRPPQPSGPRPQVRFPLPEDADPPTPTPAVPAGGDLPHWSEPPTGEVPRIFSGSADDESTSEDDLEAWAALRRQPRWREGADWEEADFHEDDELLNDEGERMGALDETAHRHDFTFDDEDFADNEPVAAAATRAPTPAPTPTNANASEPPPVPPHRAPIGVSTRPTPSDAYDYGDRGRNGGGGNGDRDLPVAVAAGAALFVVALVCFWRGPAWSAALSTVAVVLAAIELFDAFRRAGYRPATLLGLAGTAAMMVGAYVKGERAIPLILALAVVFSMLWYLLGVVRARPTHNLGITLLAFLWVGFLGSFATLMLRYPGREGVAFLLATVVAVVANDVGALFAGRQFGNTPLAPDISPNKTVEGFFGGFLATFFVCLVISGGPLHLHPWTLGSAVWLAIVVSVVGPTGDLCESMIKRDLGLKDMGNLLPGHGGLVDRFDALLFALPAVYYLVELLNVPTR